MGIYDNKNTAISSDFYFRKCIQIISIIALIITAGCANENLPSFTDSLGEAPSPVQVIKTTPSNDAQNVELNTPIQAIFNTSIDSGSIHESTLIIRQDTALIEGSLFHTDSVLTFSPAQRLKRNTLITATISSEIADTQGNSLSQDYEWNFTTRPPTAEERTPPSVADTDPRHRATDIPFSTNISARFSKSLNPETINSNTFYLQNSNSSIVSGSVNYTDSTATFNPSGPLREGTEYTAIITNDIEDLFGNSPDQNYNWTFKTKEIDRTPPRIVSTNPQDNERNVDDDIIITATFNESIDPATINQETFQLYKHHRLRGFRQISGSISYSETTATFTPAEPLQDGTDYTAIISSDITDLAGNELRKTYRWDFETEVVDDTPPRVISTNPQDDDHDVDDDVIITATFNKSMDPVTINQETFRLYENHHRQGFRQISGSVSYLENNNTARFTPNKDLRDAKEYVAIISSSITDLAGNELGEIYRWSFETEDD